jgi:SAM-dependent methyltransferase
VSSRPSLRRAAREVLRRAGLIEQAQRALEATLGNPRFRRRVTHDFSSGKVAFGEKNRYVSPVFPLDWIRVDWEGADIDFDLGAPAPLPFPDRSQRLLYAAHVVEHLPQPAFERFLGECHRILVPGGALRIETPDAAWLVEAYRRRDARFLDHFRAIRQRDLVTRLGFPPRYLEDQLSLIGELSNYIDHPRNSGHIPVYAARDEVDRRVEDGDLAALAAWALSLQTAEQRASGGHQNWMSWPKLEAALRSAGFARVERVDREVTTIPGLVLGARRGGIREKPHRAFYSVYVEAFRLA